MHTLSERPQTTRAESWSALCVPQTAEVVQFMLVKDQKKIPIRRAGTCLFSVSVGAKLLKVNVCERKSVLKIVLETILLQSMCLT